jgi:hypothetical protein
MAINCDNNGIGYDDDYIIGSINPNVTITPYSYQIWVMNNTYLGWVIQNEPRGKR